MKVILMRDVAKLGKRNTVAEVPDGYAQNKLIPTKMAIPATPANLKRLIKEKNQAHAATTSADEAFSTALEKLKNVTVVVTMPANEQGHLFQAVKLEEIGQALVVAGVHGIPLSAISSSEPIKSCGEHSVALQHNGMSATLTLIVEAK